MSTNSVQELPLYHEHCLLAARFATADDDVVYVKSYESGFASSKTDTRLCDLSGALMLVASGTDAGRFVSTALARPHLAIGQAGFSAVYAGDGRCLGTPLLMRTGEQEFVIFDASEAAPTIYSWLMWLASVEQDNLRAFPQLTLQDEEGSLVPLLLSGPDTSKILTDYLKSPELLPVQGQVSSTQLDSITCLLSCLPHTDTPSYVVFVPPTHARILWRSFLSFTELSPAGYSEVELYKDAFASIRSELHQGMAAQLDLLRSYELIRDDLDFVGARALCS